MYSSDQSIRIAYLEVRKARLLPWSALTRLGPQLAASGNYTRSESALTRPVTETEAAQEVANALVSAGIVGILNFSPAVLSVPEDVMVNNVNVAIELENLSYFIQE